MFELKSKNLNGLSHLEINDIDLKFSFYINK